MMRNIINVRLDRLMWNPWQTRMGTMDQEGVKELALDIASNGLLQAPVGRVVMTDYEKGGVVGVNLDVLNWTSTILESKLHEGNTLRVQLAFGHRRLEAFKLLLGLVDHSNVGESSHTTDGWTTMPVEIRTLSDEEMAQLAWSENEKRVGVNAADRALSIERWMSDFGWSQAEVGEKLGLARSTVSNILRLGGLPGHMLEALRQGLISERVGMALLPMYRLPERTLKLAESNWYCNPKQIERHALEGKSSNSVRDDVARLYEAYTVKMQGNALVKLDEVFPEGLVGGYDAEGGEIYCGTCRACDLRLKDEGNVCLDKSCYKAKEAVAKRRYLDQASQACGIKVVDPLKGGSTTHLPSNEEDTKKILGTGCENLRLEYSIEDRKGDGRHVVGWEHAMIVCDKRNHSCTCIKGLDLLKVRGAGTQVQAAIQAQREADPNYEGEDEDEEYSGDDPEEELVRMIDEEYSGDDPEEELVRMIDEEDPTPALPKMQDRHFGEGDGAKVLDAKALEEEARKARKAKAEVTRHYKELREKVVKVLVDSFGRDEPGAFYLLAYQSSFVATWRNDPLNIDKLYYQLAEGVANWVINANVNNVDELYEVANQNLAQLMLEQVNQVKTLAEVFAEDEDQDQNESMTLVEKYGQSVEGRKDGMK